MSPVDVLRFWAIVFVIGGSVDSFAAIEPVNDGATLARELRALRPIESGELSATMMIRNEDGSRNLVPVVVRTLVASDHWTSIYEVKAPSGRTVERLTIMRPPGSRPHYYLTAASSDGSDRQLDDSGLMRPLAESDFWLADLGMDFIYWPHQRLADEVKITMRKGIACRVLESSKEESAVFGYNRVLSWISLENGGLVYAEAFDSGGRLVKVFEVGKVEKVDGEWRLRELKIRNKLTGTKTVLNFLNK